jgi:hypothetical protein
MTSFGPKEKEVYTLLPLTGSTSLACGYECFSVMNSFVVLMLTATICSVHNANVAQLVVVQQLQKLVQKFD